MTESAPLFIDLEGEADHTDRGKHLLAVALGVTLFWTVVIIAIAHHFGAL